MVKAESQSRARTSADDVQSSAATTGARNNSSSLRRALLVLEQVAQVQSDDHSGVTLTSLSRDLGLSKSTILRLTAPLVEYGLLQRGGGPGRYVLGARAAHLGGIYLDSLDLRSVAHPLLEELSKITGETVYLGILDDLAVVYVDKVDSPNAIRMHAVVGSRQPLHCTSLGKAMLAFGDSALVDAVVAAGLPQRTPNTLTSEEGLVADLARIRARGFAVDEIENELGVRCVGAAVIDHQGKVMGAISVSGPETRVTAARADEVGSNVRDAAEKLSALLGAPGGHSSRPSTSEAEGAPS